MGKHKGLALKHLETVFTAGAVGSLPDGLILERFLAGRGNAESSSAFAALVERHGPMVLGVCHDVLRHYQDAEDAAQATFLTLAKQGRSIRRVESLASWLYGVALRVSARAKVEAARRRVVERRGAEMNAQMQSSEREELSTALHEELSRLPEKYRSPIVLCHLEGLSNEHAALQLGVPVRSIQRRLAQGRERLRLRLTRRGAEPAIGLLAARAATQDAPEAWVNSTVRVGCGLAAGQELARRGVCERRDFGGRGSLSDVHWPDQIRCGSDRGGGGRHHGLRGHWPRDHREPAARSTAHAEQRERRRGQRRKAADPSSVRIGGWLKGVVVDASGAPVGGGPCVVVLDTRPGSRDHESGRDVCDCE